MNCDESRALFADLLGEEISTSNAGGLKDHLQSCADCRRELAGLSRTRNLIEQGWPEESIPQNLVFEFTQPSVPGFWGLWERSGLARLGLATLTVTAGLILCFVSLALLQTHLTVGRNGVAVSFGRTVGLPSAQVDGGAQAPSSLPALFTRQEIQNLINQAVLELEKNQEARLEQASVQMDARRTADLRRIANELRVLESTQNIVYRETLSNQSYVETLARDMVLKMNAPSRVSQ